jgi:hypothetical protein
MATRCAWNVSTLECRIGVQFLFRATDENHEMSRWMVSGLRTNDQNVTQELSPRMSSSSVLVLEQESSLEIWGSHYEDYEDYRILGCDAVQSGSKVPFRKNLLPPSSRQKGKPCERTKVQIQEKQGRNFHFLHPQTFGSAPSSSHRLLFARSQLRFLSIYLTSFILAAYSTILRIEAENYTETLMSLYQATRGHVP